MSPLLFMFLTAGITLIVIALGLLGFVWLILKTMEIPDGE